jgi:hypothetical protein
MRAAAITFLVATLAAQLVLQHASNASGQTAGVSFMMPAIGEKFLSEEASGSEFPGSPILDGMSFDILTDLIKTLLIRRVTCNPRNA